MSDTQNSLIWCYIGWDELRVGTIIYFLLQALRCALQGLMEEKDHGVVGSTEGQAVALAHDYLEKFVSEHTHYLSSRFISEALDLLRNVSVWLMFHIYIMFCHHFSFFQVGKPTSLKSVHWRRYWSAICLPLPIHSAFSWRSKSSHVCNPCILEVMGHFKSPRFY